MRAAFLLEKPKPMSIGQEYAKTFGVDDPTRGTSKLPPQTQQNLRELYAMMRRNPPKPVTLINMHPFVLTVNGVYHRDIQVPACPPGTPYIKYVIRRWKYTRDPYEEENTICYRFRPVYPIDLATDFLREYAHMGGIVVYEGETAPEKVKDIAQWNIDGSPVMEVVEMPDGPAETQKFESYQEAFERARGIRDAYYDSCVKEAEAKWSDPSGKLRLEVSDMDEWMAEVLFLDGKRAKRADFKRLTRQEAGLSEMVCPNCKARPNQDALTCTNCNLYVFDPVAAYQNAVIEYGHPSMDRLDAEQWEAINEIKAKRDTAKLGKPKKVQKHEAPVS